MIKRERQQNGGCSPLSPFPFNPHQHHHNHHPWMQIGALTYAASSSSRRSSSSNSTIGPYVNAADLKNGWSGKEKTQGEKKSNYQHDDDQQGREEACEGTLLARNNNDRDDDGGKKSPLTHTVWTIGGCFVGRCVACVSEWQMMSHSLPLWGWLMDGERLDGREKSKTKCTMVRQKVASKWCTSSHPASSYLSISAAAVILLLLPPSSSLYL